MYYKKLIIFNNIYKLLRMNELFNIAECIERSSIFTINIYNKYKEIINKTYSKEVVELVEFAIEYICFAPYYNEDYDKLFNIKRDHNSIFNNRMKLYMILLDKKYIELTDDQQKILDFTINIYKKNNYRKYNEFFIIHILQYYTFYAKYIKKHKSAKKNYKILKRIEELYFTEPYNSWNENDFDEDGEYFGNDKYTKTLINIQKSINIENYNKYIDFEIIKQLSNNIKNIAYNNNKINESIITLHDLTKSIKYSTPIIYKLYTKYKENFNTYFTKDDNEVILFAVEYIIFNPYYYPILDNIYMDSELIFNKRIELYKILLEKKYIKLSKDDGTSSNKDEYNLLYIIVKIYNNKNNYKNYNNYLLEDFFEKYYIYKKFTNIHKSINKNFKKIKKIYNLINKNPYDIILKDDIPISFSKDDKYIGNNKYVKTLINFQNYVKKNNNKFKKYDNNIKEKIVNKLQNIYNKYIIYV